MYKVIVVDDEKNIRERLTHFFPWTELGFEVVGTAENGYDGLELVKKLNPDVVLTDVRMPIMTGLELAKEIQASFPEIKVIILSAYDDFEYAQGAIRYGVRDYLLKPVMREEFYKTFRKIIEELQVEKKRKTFSNLNKQLNREESMLLKLIKGEKIESIEKQVQEQTDYFRVAIISFGKLIKENSTFSFRQKITEISANYWKMHQVKILFYDNNLILLLTERTIASKQIIKKNIHLFIEVLQDKINELTFDEKCFFIGVGNTYYHIEEISHSYNEAIFAYNYKYFNEDETIFFYEDLPIRNESIQSSLNIDLQDYVNRIVEALMRSLQIGDNSELIELVSNLFNSTQRFYGANIAGIRTFLIELVIILFYRINEKGVDTSSINHKEMLQNINELNSLAELKRYLVRIFEIFTKDMSSKYEKSVDRYVLLAQEYVSKNYRNKITLEDVSSYLFLNPAYFSAFFKKETGENFIDYVNKVRVDKAKGLLSKAHLQIKVISDRVGFQNHSYFIKVFKKETGLTPHNFRKQQSKMSRKNS
nr:response regulator transcription factor [Fredinandcohnia onubensis]